MQGRYWKILKKGGILVSVATPPSTVEARAHDVCAEYVFMQPRGSQLIEIAKLVDAGKLRPHVETLLPLSKARYAHALGQSGNTRGKIALQICRE